MKIEEKEKVQSDGLNVRKGRENNFLAGKSADCLLVDSAAFRFFPSRSAGLQEAVRHHFPRKPPEFAFTLSRVMQTAACEVGRVGGLGRAGTQSTYHHQAHRIAR
jgi:hypothetical protein